ncbi:MAG: UDP-GlcNAc--UDP-phosphate GlcNAc-1-phosphate transferase [Bacteroidota bacterium]|nr:UDP-GlcNAc--UDP-phosphate GlcNAc-1-phosphate transferase [Bacteroidota bacterium]
MLQLYYFVIAPLGMILLSFLYLQFAKKFNIYDHPVGRSSHVNVTITGYGIFVLFALLVYSVIYPYTLPSFFIIGLVMISTISFIDDIVFIKHFIRLIFQIFALTLMAIDLPFSYIAMDKLPLIIAAIIFGIGVLNAFNFMDGINGMLGLNSLVILFSFWWLNNHSVDENGANINFINNEFIYTLIIGVSLFVILNVRKKAIVFAGDVGSISIAFVIFYLMLNLIFKTGNYAYLLLFVVIGIDAGLTVIFKLLLRENIFVPHRDFLFKKLVHVGKFKHVNVSLIYASIQAIISFIVIVLPLQNKLPAQLSILFIFVVGLCAAYIITRNKYTKKRVIKYLREDRDDEEV